MNLYLVSQSEVRGYDTYDSMVVAAETKEIARGIYPAQYSTWGDSSGVWATSPMNVTAELIGTATPNIPRGVILASFNAG